MRGDYDWADRHLIGKYVRRGDFVLELGTGCGLTAMVARRTVGGTGKVVTIEPDIDMFEVATHNFARNGMIVRSMHGAAMISNIRRQADFYRCNNYWSSSLLNHGDGICERIKVPVINPLRLASEEHGRRRVLICDTEGYETTLLAKREFAKCFDVIIMEVHNYGRPQKAESVAIGRLFQVLIDLEFAPHESLSHSWVWCRRRGARR